MKVFVTGGSGRLGAALIPQLIATGHQVTALARSDASATTVTLLGAVAIRGTHQDLDVLKQAASEADAAIHLAYSHDIAFTGGLEKATAEDRAALSALGDGLVASNGTNKTLINASGLLPLPSDADEYALLPESSPRAQSEIVTHSYGRKGIRTINVRLAPICAGDGQEHPFFSVQIQAAKVNRFAAIVEGGTALWSGTHADDIASLYVKALERAPYGVNLHGIGDGNIPTRAFAELISGKLGVPAKDLTVEEAESSNLGVIGRFLSWSGSPSTKLTKEWTGWEPVKSNLLEQLAKYRF